MELLCTELDLKPSNILLDCGRARVADFGCSRVKPRAASRLSAGAGLVGTIPYMAPELVGEGSLRKMRRLQLRRSSVGDGDRAQAMARGEP